MSLFSSADLLCLIERNKERERDIEKRSMELCNPSLFLSFLSLSLSFPQSLFCLFVLPLSPSPSPSLSQCAALCPPLPVRLSLCVRGGGT